MDQTLYPWLKGMFQEAKNKWPSLTWEMFQEAGQEILAEHNKPLSLEDMAKYLEEKLEAKMR